MLDCGNSSISVVVEQSVLSSDCNSLNNGDFCIFKDNSHSVTVYTL